MILLKGNWIITLHEKINPKAYEHTFMKINLIKLKQYRPTRH